MLRRSLSLFLTVAVLCCCMTVTVGASELDFEQTQLINVLELATPNDSGNMWVYKSADGFASASFTLPYSTLIRYVDMVISVQGGLSTASLGVGSTYTPLTIEPISGTTYYRVYGVFSGAWADTFVLEFQSTTAAVGYIQFYSLDFSAQPLQVFASPSTFLVEDQSITQSSGSDLATLEVILNAPFDAALEWTSSVRNDNWRKYDYMTFTLSYWTHSISNINVQIGGKPVPFTYNMIENPPGFDSHPADGVYGVIDNIYSISLTVDLTGFQRTTSGELIVTIQGLGTFVTASLHNGSGYVPADLPEGEISWLQRIWNTLTEGFRSVVDAITGDTGAADEFQDAVSDKTEEMGEISGSMDSIQHPDDFDPEIPEMENVGNLVNSGGILYIMSSPYILPLAVSSTMLCFVGYALFGKKG